MTRTLSVLALLAAAPVVAADRADLLVADFEGDAYPPGWTTTGTAFGKGPAKGTLPGQMPVSGFLGKGLVNSFLGGDAATGTLTSPAFKLERKYLNFLVGGGRHPGKTCVNLLVGGKVVRTATGPNGEPGGSEHLDWHTWDVAEFAGKDATIQVVDEAAGGWGHVNVDQVVQSDAKKQAEPVTLSFTIGKRYLHLPVKTGAPMRRMKFVVGGETVREFDLELDTAEKPAFWTFADVSAFKGKKLDVVVMLPAGSRVPVTGHGDDVPDAEKLYREKHRPLFHFTSRFGWLNDPNGLVYHAGEWHLFYQHNPFGVNWGNMHWGHAVSPDLVSWKELGIGLYPRKHGDWAFSGSAVVDAGNTSGWGTKEKPPLVLAYTSTGRGECIAHSTDNGRTWTEYAGNPVVKHAGRDPKLVWYEKGKHWVMAVYDEFQGKQWITFHTSPDLKAWTFASRIEGFFECPDLFEMPTDAGFGRAWWVLYAADGKYLLGDFDGKTFTPAYKDKKQLWYGRFYAAQTFDNAPKRALVDGPTPALPVFPRRIQVGWANGVTFPGMPFNQQMTVPVELMLATGADARTLTNDKGGLRLRARPARELDKLRDKTPAFAVSPDEPRAVGERLTLAADLDAFDVELVIDPGKAAGFALDLRGTRLEYDAAKGTLACKDVTAPLPKAAGPVSLRVLVDRGSVEVFVAGGWNDYYGLEAGDVAMSVAAVPGDKARTLDLVPRGGAVTIQRAGVYRMRSAWGK